MPYYNRVIILNTLSVLGNHISVGGTYSRLNTEMNYPAVSCEVKERKEVFPIKIVVLAGGLSPERDVSLSSGSLIANALIENGHIVFLLDVYKGTEIPKDGPKSLFLDARSGAKYSYVVPQQEPDLEALKKETQNGKTLIGKNVLTLCQYADIVFNALHGATGENGQLQATFDNFGIRYTGSGYIGSLLAMDKDIAKKLMMHHHIKTVPWIRYDTAKDGLDTACSEIGFPCVIKPCSCGSSVGVSIVNNRDEMAQAIQSAQKYEASVLIEKLIPGREFSVGILGDIALPVIEIIPKAGFYDYKNKYQPGLTEEICPAVIFSELTQRLQTTALQVHNTLRLGYYSRIDFIAAPDNECFCLEANTLPGMTPTSLLPQEAKAAGISYNELCEKIAMSAL